MLKNATLVLALVFLVISCGAPEGESQSKPNIQKQESRLEASTKVNFTCFEDGQCSDSFVLSINSASDFPLYCTGYLANKNHMIVPSHCLAKASCEQIAAKTISGEILKCKSIEDHNTKIDKKKTFNGEFSVVELTPSLEGELTPVSDSKMRDFHYYQLWYVRKNLGNSGYQLRRMRYNCRKTTDNVIFPGNNYDSSVVAMKNCNLKNEAMGAAVVDTRSGEVLGLVHDAISEDKTYRRFMHGRRGTSLTLATPINCILKEFNMETKSYDDSLKYCNRPVYRPGTENFSKQLKSLFTFSSTRSIKNVFTRLTSDELTGEVKREFFAMEYEVLPYRYPRVKVCRFNPYLDRNYEVYGGDYTLGCYDEKLNVVYKETQMENSFSIYDDFGNLAIKVHY
ncbi:putative lipoprotein [Halobacteriovorax sp. BALOs_7]|uniref:hypothetical protein n=1 Tax=Halobacteriovorax sp. BALOs_7 TaxID=2109558 RepID=UPI000EA3FC3C|nr:hypothetical protein [Halobacteriovorax sp. BALOs_7]AYF44964.1 putative lipoprotein [Halobacteriovorax sp. BALOs_7]